MARKWLSFLNSLWSRILNLYISHCWQLRWMAMVLCGLLLAMSFHAIAFSQIQMTEGQVVEALNQAGELSSHSLQHQQQGEWQAAEETINESLDILNSLPVTENRERIYGQTLDILGQLYFARGEFDLALKTWENSEITYRNLGDRDRVRKSYINQSRALQRLGLYDRSCNALLVATGLQENLEGFPEITTLKCRQFIQLEKVFQPEEKDKELSEEMKCDRLRQAIGDFAISCDRVKELEKALQISDDSLSVIAEIRLGNVLRALGELEISVKILEQIKPKNHSLEQAAKINLSLGNTQRAIRNRDRAYNDAKQQPNFEFKLCRQDESGSTKALDYYLANDRVSMVQPSPDFINAIVESRINALSLALELEEDPDTIKKLRSQLAYLQAISPQNPQQDRLILDYVKTLSCAGDPNWDNLKEQLAKVADNAKQRHDWRMESIALGYIGMIYEQEYLQLNSEKKEENRFEKILNNAKFYTVDALKIAQPREKEARDINYRFQWQLGRIYSYQGNRKSAIDRYKAAYQNLKNLRINFAAFNQEIQYDLRDKVEPVHRELVSLLLRSQPTQEQLNLARQVIESLQLIELDSFVQDTCTETDNVKIDEIDKNAAVLYTIALSDGLHIILSLPDKEGLFLHRKANKFAEFIIEDLEIGLQTRPSQNEVKYQDDLEELNDHLKLIYTRLVKPFESYLQEYEIQTLVFALDGSLRSIPIAALYDGEKYLVEKYAVAVTPSLQLLESRKITFNTLRVLAAGAEKFPEFPDFPNLDDLTGVRNELNQIEATISTTEILLDDDFTGSELRRKINSSKFPIVHIATHGQFGGTPTETFIFSSKERINLEQLGQILRVSNPSGLKDIELLIFSACQTAQGNRRATLGMAGVAFKADARSVIGTLWNVQDESTAIVMSEFYNSLKDLIRSEKSANKAKALQLAQLVLWNYQEGQYKHPHYWSPFILVGNWL